MEQFPLVAVLKYMENREVIQHSQRAVQAPAWTDQQPPVLAWLQDWEGDGLQMIFIFSKDYCKEFFKAFDMVPYNILISKWREMELISGLVDG